jgi:hypothetical protein
MAESRSEPALDASEKDTLCGWMDSHRATILRKIDGLGEDDLYLREQIDGSVGA